MGLTIAAVKYGKEFDHFKIGYLDFKELMQKKIMINKSMNS